MRAVLQRVSRASVMIDGQTIGAIECGLLVLVGVVATGQFGAMMEVDLVNDGPVTLVLDSRLRE